MKKIKPERISRELELEMIRMRREGIPPCQIAEQCGVSRSCVTKYTGYLKRAYDPDRIL